MDFGDELPCGGFPQQDQKIRHNMKILSEENNQTQKATDSQTKNQKTQIECCNQCDCDQSKCSNKKEQRKQEKEGQANQEKLEQRKITDKICKKCKNNAPALIHKNQPICKECLLKNIQYKCRLTLENSMKVKQNSKLLLCFSGGINSICLAHIMASLQKRYQKHKLFGTLQCLHIQQQNDLPTNYKENFEKQTGLNLEVIPISQIFEGNNQKNLQDVRKIFGMFGKAANTADLLILFRDRLILDYARKNNYDFILKGLNGESIAGQIFKFFTKGIGGDVTELASKQPDSLFHFPLRQHLQKQLQFYFYSNRCNKISMKSQEDDLSNLCTRDLDNHLNDFILNLQTMYSHTAPAITRTSQKIQSNRRNEDRCKWCQLKGSFGEHKLCRKCERIFQNRNKNYDLNRLPEWFKLPV